MLSFFLPFNGWCVLSITFFWPGRDDWSQQNLSNSQTQICSQTLAFCFCLGSVQLNPLGFGIAFLSKQRYSFVYKNFVQTCSKSTVSSHCSEQYIVLTSFWVSCMDQPRMPGSSRIVWLREFVVLHDLYRVLQFLLSTAWNVRVDADAKSWGLWRRVIRQLLVIWTCCFEHIPRRTASSVRSRCSRSLRTLTNNSFFRIIP